MSLGRSGRTIRFAGCFLALWQAAGGNAEAMAAALQGRARQPVSQSAATVPRTPTDRLTAAHRAQCKHCGHSGTKPGSLLKHHIPSRTDHWDIPKSG